MSRIGLFVAPKSCPYRVSLYVGLLVLFVFIKIGTYVEKMFQSELSGNVIGAYCMYR